MSVHNVDSALILSSYIRYKSFVFILPNVAILLKECPFLSIALGTHTCSFDYPSLSTKIVSFIKYFYECLPSVVLIFFKPLYVVPYRYKNTTSCIDVVDLVEVRGVEPLSEDPSIRISPITVLYLTFPLSIAKGHAIGFSSFIFSFYSAKLRNKSALLI